MPQQPSELGPLQEKCIQLLLAGSTVAAAARELGIDRTTIYSWRKTNPFFSVALNRARELHSQIIADGLQDLASTALDTLRELLTSPEVPAAVRLRAAQTVLNSAQAPGSQSSVAEAQPEPQVNHAAIEALIGPPDIQHNSTDFDTFLRQFASTGPNDPCLCGSGQKFKRCCGNPVPVTAAAAA